MAPRENLNLADIQPEKTKKKLERKNSALQISVPGNSRKVRKRKGRGHSSGMGKTSSRGQKGQKARAGFSRTAGFEGGQMPLHRRLPKRGFRSINKTVYQLVNLNRIEKAGLSGEITPDMMRKSGLIRKSNELIKVLGNGEAKGALKITADAFTKGAQQKIEAAGGSCQTRDLKTEKKAVKTEAAARKA
ncbi:MAG: 50S ribosomal protein L15 [Leptospiraceae bacterium]|nr:50S ribosomal protein L15 [Leptospiraceae bacterium]